MLFCERRAGQKRKVLIINILQLFQKMQLQTERTCDQSKHSSQEDVESLKKKIAFSNAQLHAIISNPQTFTLRIKELNRMAIKQITDQAYQQALIYLSEAEKNLQYAASCGLSLDRHLITTTLKNQACAYQRLWELATCYDYMEALIFNLSIYAEDNQAFSLTEQIKDPQSEESQKLNKILNQKLTIAMCYLHFSALSSQLGKHDQARRFVEKSLEQFKILCDYCQTYERKAKGKMSSLLCQIREILRFEPIAKTSKLLKQCKIAIEKVKNYRCFFNFDSKLIEKLRMGDIMEIKFSTIEDANQIETEWFISQLGLTYIGVYISCCYFALATEIRLGIQKNILGEEQMKSDIIKAKIYHLHSIKIASETVQIESSFLNHIIKSFQTNFSIDIINHNIQEHEQFDQISEISIKQKKHSVSIKASQQSKKYETMIFKGDDEGTKIQTIESQINSFVDPTEKKVPLKKEANQKLQVTEAQHLPQHKVTKFPKKLVSKQKNIKDGGSSKSRGNKHVKNSSKSQKKGMNNQQKGKLKLNTQYFWNKQEQQKNKEDRNLISPRNKIVRKSQSSRSKLKLKTLKSPTKL